MKEPSIVINFIGNSVAHSFVGDDCQRILKSYLYKMNGIISLPYTTRKEPINADCVSVVNWDNVLNWKIYDVSPEMLADILDEVNKDLRLLHENREDGISKPAAYILPTNLWMEQYANREGIQEDEIFDNSESELHEGGKVPEDLLQAIFEEDANSPEDERLIPNEKELEEAIKEHNDGVERLKRDSSKKKKKKEKNFLEGDIDSGGELF